MIEFFRAGGFHMWVVLALGAATLVASFGLWREPDPRRLGVVRAFTWSTAFATVVGTTSDLIAVFHTMARHEELGIDALYQGLAEALSPLVLGAAMLSVAWLVVAVAVRGARDV